MKKQENDKMSNKTQKETAFDYINAIIHSFLVNICGARRNLYKFNKDMGIAMYRIKKYINGGELLNFYIYLIRISEAIIVPIE